MIVRQWPLNLPSVVVFYLTAFVFGSCCTERAHVLFGVVFVCWDYSSSFYMHKPPPVGHWWAICIIDGDVIHALMETGMHMTTHDYQHPPLILFSTPWSRPLWSQCCRTSAMYGYDGQAGCRLRQSKYVFHYITFRDSKHSFTHS